MIFSKEFIKYQLSAIIHDEYMSANQLGAT